MASATCQCLVYMQCLPRCALLYKTSTTEEDAYATLQSDAPDTSKTHMVSCYMIESLPQPADLIYTMAFKSLGQGFHIARHHRNWSVKSWKKAPYRDAAHGVVGWHESTLLNQALNQQPDHTFCAPEHSQNGSQQCYNKPKQTRILHLAYCILHQNCTLLKTWNSCANMNDGQGWILRVSQRSHAEKYQQSIIVRKYCAWCRHSCFSHQDVIVKMRLGRKVTYGWNGAHATLGKSWQTLPGGVSNDKISIMWWQAASATTNYKHLPIPITCTCDDHK